MVFGKIGTQKRMGMKKVHLQPEDGVLREVFSPSILSNRPSPTKSHIRTDHTLVTWTMIMEVLPLMLQQVELYDQSKLVVIMPTYFKHFRIGSSNDIIKQLQNG